MEPVLPNTGTSLVNYFFLLFRAAAPCALAAKLPLDTLPPEVFAVVLCILEAALGVILLLGYIMGPSKEVRLMKRNEAKVMLIPTVILLFILAAIIFSGVLDPIP